MCEDLTARRLVTVQKCHPNILLNNIRKWISKKTLQLKLQTVLGLWTYLLILGQKEDPRWSPGIGWGNIMFLRWLLFARKISESSEAGDIPVLNLTVKDVEGNCFLQYKTVLYNLESQFTKVLWSSLRDLALVTLSILKCFFFCNWSDSVPSHFTDPSCKIQIKNMKPQSLQLLNLPKCTYPQNQASNDRCSEQHAYFDFSILEKAPGYHTQDIGLSPSLSLKRTVKMKSFQRNLFKPPLQFYSLVKGRFFYHIFGGKLSS